jgi:hypothetical protein
MTTTSDTYVRPRYFAGQLLTEADLRTEQAYRIAKDRLHNRMLHGTGVVCGLQAVCHPECRGWVTVLPGYAIDPCGNDVVVEEATDFDVIAAVRRCREAQRRSPADCDRLTPVRERCPDVEEEWCITLTYEEHECRPIAAVRSSCGCDGNGNGNSAALPCEPTRIVETFRLGVAPPPQEDGEHAPSFTSQTRECMRTYAPFMPAIDLEGLETERIRVVVRDYLAGIEAAMQAHPVLHCDLRTRLAALTCPRAGQPEDVREAATLVIEEAREIAEAAMLDCACAAMLPPCPEPPGDRRLIVACVTVRGDQLVRVCPCDHRRQVIGFALLDHYLADAVPYAREALHTLWGSGNPAIFLLALASQRQFSSVLERYCCEGHLTLTTLFGNPEEDG